MRQVDTIASRKRRCCHYFEGSERLAGKMCAPRGLLRERYACHARSRSLFAARIDPGRMVHAYHKEQRVHSVRGNRREQCRGLLYPLAARREAYGTRAVVVAQEKYRVRGAWIVITDSHTIPLRRGVLGISLAHYGFVPLKDYRGKLDLFGRELKMTQTNIADGLAAAAVVLMGEGSECTPLAVIRDVPFVRFVERPAKSRKPFSSFEIKTKEDLYYPLFSSVSWQKGGHIKHM